MGKIPVRWQTAARILAVVSLLAAACTTPSGGPVTTSEPVVLKDILQQKLALQCEEGKEWWRDPGPPKRGGVFVTAGLAVGGGTAQLLDIRPGGNGPQQVYSYLLQTRACYYEDTAVVPGIIKSWEVSADGRTWTLKLQNNLKWHNLPPVNGRPVTSADVAWTIDLLVKESALGALWRQVAHREPDAHTIVLTLKEPDPDFLVSTLAERRTVLLPREVYEQYGDFKSVAVGSGPFMLAKWQHQVVLERVRNPDWPEKGADGQPLPYLDGITTFYFGDTSAEVAAARAGKIDRTGLQTFLKIDADAFKLDYPKFRPHTGITGCPWGGFINPMRKPFDDVRVRRAIGLALDQEEMIQGALAGGGIPTGYLPVAITQFAWPVAKVKEKFKIDLEEAKRLLAEAGYGPNNPVRFKMYAGSTGGDSGRIEVAQQQLKRIGVETTLELLDVNSSTPLANLDIANGKYDSVWGTRSPCTFESTLWMGTFYLTGSPRNVTGISDPKLDALAKAQMAELDPVKRKQILDEMQDYVFELRPFFPTDSRMYFRFDHCRVKNMHGMDWHDYLTGLKEAWLDPTGC